MSLDYGKESVRRQLKVSEHNGEKLVSRVLIGSLKVVFLVFVVVCLIAGSFVLGVIEGIVENAPDSETLTVTPLGMASIIYDQDGKITETLIKSGSNREPVPFSALPDDLINAFVAVEDARFWTHEGIDVRGILRSAFSLLSSGGFNGGASTITQQLIKNNVFNGGIERGWGARFIRKFQEQYLATVLEKEVSKEDILINYLNTINLGSNSLGVQVAAQRYFAKDVGQLTLSECACIAGITQNPYRYNPITFPERNAVRRAYVLDCMEEQGYITAAQKQEALDDTDAMYERIAEINLRIKTTAGSYSYFTDAVIEQVLKDLQTQLGYSEADAYTLLYSGGLNIYTTQNSKLQSILDEEINDPANYPDDALKWSFNYQVNATLADGTTVTYREYHIRNHYNLTTLIYNSQGEIRDLIERYKADVFGPGDVIADEAITFTIQPQFSGILIDQKTGHVLAVSGGRGEKVVNRAYNRATDTYRSPGSTFKVISTYAPALEECGQSLASIQQDLPYTYNGTVVKNWWPSSMWLGNCTARQGIAYSMNVVTVNFMMNTVGMERAFRYLQSFGISSLVEEKEINGRVYTDLGPTLCMGALTNGCNLIDLTAAYGTIGNKGVYVEPTFYTAVTDHNGKILLSKEQDTHRVISESTAFLLTSAMQSSMVDEQMKGTWISTTSTRAHLDGISAAGKSGTSTDSTGKSRDYWFVGYTSNYTLGVWSGFDEGGVSLEGNVTLNSYHQGIWKKVMERASAGISSPSFVMPTGLKMMRVCSLSGKLAVPGVCELDDRCSVYYEYFTEDTVPKEYCDIHRLVLICDESHCEANEYCPAAKEKLYYDLPRTDVDTVDTPYTYVENYNPPRCTIHSKAWADEQKRLEEEARAAQESQNSTEP